MTEFLGKLWQLTRPYKWRLGLGVFCGILSGFAEPLLLLTVVCVVKVIFPEAQDDTVTKQLARLPGFFRGFIEQWEQWLPGAGGSSATVMVLVVSTIPLVMLVRGVVTYLNSYLLNWVSVRAISDLRTRLFAHLLNLPLTFLTRTSTGELMSRTYDVVVLHNLILGALITVVKDPITLVTYIVFLLMLQPWLTLAVLLVFPLCMIPVVIYSRKVRHSSAAIQTQYAELSKLMQESFSGNRIIKAYNLENPVLDQFKHCTRRFISHYMRVNRAFEIPGPLSEFVGAVGVALILLFLHFSSGQRTSPANFFGFVMGIFGMYRPFKTIIRLHSQLVQARAASERVFELLATPSTILDPPRPKALPAAQADIHFDGIEFAYGEKTVLHNIQLTVKGGQLMALVGSSGSGKTTLTNLLLRFYDPQQGAVRIGETDIRQVTLRDLRSQIAVVTQETILFNDTIRNNIALGRPGASQAEIEAAARSAYAHNFILEKPHGYDSVVGEKGMELSGGERQRLAIARAILKNAPILILDEATNALDTEAERIVQAALEQLMKGRTTLCIAHRLSTIQNADVIVVLSEGRIVETGRHADLLKRGGVYHRLYELQFAA